MRISVWSSDVCFSDMCERLAAETITRRQGNKKGPVSRPPCPLRPASAVAARPAQAVARNPPDLVLVEAERHQFTHRLLRLGERGGHCDVEVEALGHLRPHQLGRAYSGAIVCHYVNIPVVALSLKKNHLIYKKQQ